MNDYYSDEQIRKNIREKKLRRRRNRRIAIICIALILAVVDGVFIGKAIGNKRFDKEATALVPVAADMPLINTAINEIGNEGGAKFWSWYGFDSHVAWCACFVSWCESKNGYLSDGTGTKFASVQNGIDFFKSKGRWINGGEEPAPGDLIFFDWEPDGLRDHVGIVTQVIDDTVFAVEGNSSDRCRMKRYMIDDDCIYGYGKMDKA